MLALRQSTDLLSPLLLPNLNREQLGWLVGVLSLAADFAYPTVLTRLLFCENIDLVVAHALLCHNDFLIAVNNEVATLVVATVLAILHSLVFIQIFELAKVGAQHHRHFAYKDACEYFFIENLLYLSFSLPCLRTVVEVIFQLFFTKLNIRVQLGAVSKIAHASLMGENWHHAVVGFHDTRRNVYLHLSEFNFVDDVLVCLPTPTARRILGHFFNLDFTIFSHNVLHVELKEAIERFNLLANQAVLLEVGANNSPRVVGIDWSVFVKFFHSCGFQKQRLRVCRSWLILSEHKLNFDLNF